MPLIIRQKERGVYIVMTEKRSMEEIKRSFFSRFEELARADGIVLGKNCFDHGILDVMILYQDENLSKVMLVCENEGRAWEFGGHMEWTGELCDQKQLSLYVTDCDTKAEAIYDLYKRWFVDNESPRQVREVLVAYEKKFEINAPVIPGDGVKKGGKKRYKRRHQRHCYYSRGKGVRKSPRATADERFILRWFSIRGQKLFGSEFCKAGMLMGWETLTGITQKDFEAILMMKVVSDGVTVAWVTPPVCEHVQRFAKTKIDLDKYSYRLEYQHRHLPKLPDIYEE